MDYKKLFTAIKAEIKRRKLRYSQISELAHVNYHTLKTWLETAAKPERNYTVNGFLALVDMLNINLDEFANHDTLAGRLELLRWKNKLTIHELAKKSGVSGSVIQNIEYQGFKNPKYVTLEKIAKVLNSTADYLENGESKQIRNGLVELPKITVQIELEEVRATDKKFEIKITKKIIDRQEVNAVNARELWEKLGVTTKFADWIKRRIDEYEFKSDLDFCVLRNENGENKGFQPIEYFISLDMAKELSMVENNEQGKRARRYFIECEKVAKCEIQKFELGTESIVISNIRANLSEAVEIMTILGLSPKQAATSALNIVKNSTGVDILALAGNPEI